MNVSVPVGVSQVFRNFAETEIQNVLNKTEDTVASDSISTGQEQTPGWKNAVSANAFFHRSFPDFFVALWFALVLTISLFIFLWIMISEKALKQCPPISNTEIVSLVRKKCHELGIKQKVEALYLDVDITDGPTVAGVFRPRIYIPRAIVDNWDAIDTEPIISHELVHIKQNDLLVNWLQIVIQILFFFHPLVWYANIKIRQLREEVCDDIAIQLIDSKRKRYSRGILNVLEEMFSDKKLGVVGLGFSERKHSLARRILRITDKRYQYYRPMSTYAIIVLIIIYASSIDIASDSSLGKNGFSDSAKDMQAQVFSIQKIKEYVNIEIISDSEYIINGIKTTDIEFQTVLKDVMSEYKIRNISITVDPSVDQKKAFEVFDESIKAGAEFVHINK
jgi:beta-lactamase regulating signal transducer with metallopeptidase domain